jgi:hypothetical protein
MLGSLRKIRLLRHTLTDKMVERLFDITLSKQYNL